MALFIVGPILAVLFVAIILFLRWLFSGADENVYYPDPDRLIEEANAQPDRWFLSANRRFKRRMGFGFLADRENDKLAENWGTRSELRKPDDESQQPD